MRGRGSFSHIPHHVTTPRTYTYPNIRDVISSSYINVGTDENSVKETQKQVIRVKKLVGLPPPALELLASSSVSKRILCACTHPHTQPTKNYTIQHVAVDTNIVVFRPSEPHQYSINIFTQVYTLVRTHAHTQTSIS